MHHFIIRQVVVLLATLAAARSAIVPASFFFGGNGAVRSASPLLVPGWTASQFHAQDELGQASFGYAHPGQAASTFQDAFGNQVGSYAYIDANGKHVQVSFVADSNGFRVLSNDLPEAPQDEPQVAAAKAAHLAAKGQLHLTPADRVFVVAAPAPAAVPVHHPVAPVVVQADPLSLPVTVPHLVPHQVAAPVVVAALPAATISKYHAQDELGQASFGHQTADQSHSAFRDVHGNQVGFYSYINPDGNEVRVHYTAGHGGFRVLSNALPEAPSAAAAASADHSTPSIIQEADDVQAARKLHFALFEEARNRIKQAPSAAAAASR